jgi:hypothetical protein
MPGESSQDTRISMNGTVLAAMIHSAGIGAGNSCAGDVEGFLFGVRHNRTTNVMSDSQEAAQHNETNIVVSSFTSAPLFSFYSRDGTVDITKVEQIARQRSHLQLLGWFVCRRNTVLKPSLREFAVHQSLESMVRTRLEKFVGAEGGLLFGLLNFQLEQRLSTQSLEYAFGEWVTSTGEIDVACPGNNNCFAKRGVQILNLPRNAQAAYQELTPNSSSCSSSSGLSNSDNGTDPAAVLQPSSGSDVRNLESCFNAKSKEIKVGVWDCVRVVSMERM